MRSDARRLATYTISSIRAHTRTIAQMLARAGRNEAPVAIGHAPRYGQPASSKVAHRLARGQYQRLLSGSSYEIVNHITTTCCVAILSGPLSKNR